MGKYGKSSYEFDEFKKLNRAERYKIQKEKLYKDQLNKHLELNKDYFNKISLTFKKINLILNLFNSYINIKNKVLLIENNSGRCSCTESISSKSNKGTSEEVENIISTLKSQVKIRKKEIRYSNLNNLFFKKINIDELKSKDIQNLIFEFNNIKNKCINDGIIIDNGNLIPELDNKFEEYFIVKNSLIIAKDMNKFYSNINNILAS
jgi:hypothetical protein